MQQLLRHASFAKAIRPINDSQTCLQSTREKSWKVSKVTLASYPKQRFPCPVGNQSFVVFLPLNSRTYPSDETKKWWKSYRRFWQFQKSLVNQKLPFVALGGEFKRVPGALLLSVAGEHTNTTRHARWDGDERPAARIARFCTDIKVLDVWVGRGNGRPDRIRPAQRIKKWIF